MSGWMYVEARCPEAEVSGSCELPDELVQSFSPLQERQELSTAELLSSLLPFRFKTESIWHKLTLNFFIAHTGLEHLLLPQPLPTPHLQRHAPTFCSITS